MSKTAPEFRKLAEELAKVESDILKLGKFSKRNPANVQKSVPSSVEKPKTVAVFLVIAVVAFFAQKMLMEKNMNYALVADSILLASLVKAYMEWRNYRTDVRELKRNTATANEGTGMVTLLENRREELIQKLNQMCAANLALKKNYWWTAGKNPAFEAALLPGVVPDYNQWAFGQLNPAWFTKKNGGIWLEDMNTYGITFDREETLKVIKSKDNVALYQNPALLSASAKEFLVTYFYAIGLEEVKEVTASTRRTYIDKDAERAAYQRKMDGTEIVLNAFSRNAMMTDAEAQATGRISMQEYIDGQLVRGMYEADFESGLSARGDYEESTTYSKGFYGLYHLTLFKCAEILLSLEKRTNGHAATILVPRTEEKSVSLMVRAKHNDNPFCGYLEPYGGRKAIEVGGVQGVPSIQIALDHLMNPTDASNLHLLQRDVLADRPEGLDDIEYAYLIWKDNPRERK